MPIDHKCFRCVESDLISKVRSQHSCIIHSADFHSLILSKCVLNMPRHATIKNTKNCSKKRSFRIEQCKQTFNLSQEPIAQSAGLKCLRLCDLCLASDVSVKHPTRYNHLAQNEVSISELLEMARSSFCCTCLSKY
jgi:hypothetical protein